ncbi:MAG: efflux RND transporter periplasmic adaptor subunit [Acidobacteria bacterium]|nr:efflux RND transporter periplasmic adaptor subunit [Acidobacteriota bacterium]
MRTLSRRPWSASLIRLTVVLSGPVGLGGCGDSGSAASRPDTVPIPAVEAVQARQGALPLVERATGTVTASGQVAIFPETSGRVVEVLAQNGDSVRRGDALVRIQTAGSQAQLQQARSNVAVAEAEVREIEANLKDLQMQYERTRALGERGLVPRETVDTLRSQVEAAQASLARARAQLDASRSSVDERAELQRQTVVRAPIAGRVGQRDVEVGMRVDPQTQLFVVGRLDRMRIEVPVTQEILTQVREGQHVELRPGSGSSGEPIVAEVSRISPFLEPGSFSAEVEIDVPNEGRLVPGMFVTVDIHYGESQPATLVPTSAVYEDPVTGERGVYVVNEPGLAQAKLGELTSDPLPVSFRQVDVLADGRQTVGVGGVEPGEWVVVVGQHLLGPHVEDEAARARVRPADWDRILRLQGLQREDLLHGFMERQRQAARTGGRAGDR